MAAHPSLQLLLMSLAIATALLRLTSAAEPLPPTTQPTISPPPHSPPAIPPPLPPTISQSPPPPPASVTTPPPPTRQDMREQQLSNIIDALIGAGDFSAWANILSNADLSTLPLSATLFIPSSTALSSTTATVTFDPFMIPYHIVPQRLSFSDLQLFKTHTRLPTLLPSKTLLITNNSPANFTIDSSPVTHPDIYANSAVCVHGIKTLLDYNVYGDNFFPPPESTASPPQTGVNQFLPGEDAMGYIGRRSDAAACLCTEFPIVFSMLCAAFVVCKCTKYRAYQKRSYGLMSGTVDCEA
ncbi:hypothetical protein RJ639_037322 [Escallonia herrerae]|uniref:FAS1 domain-containing protein n=1 Tax=Escallonia herrerae TaxID=1293975 RepID=A0AA88WT16_9ASTE|nr:hypothetical protein RJ639_037322 [Escallonia herrerae]